MAVGVAVANSILLVTFAERARIGQPAPLATTTATPASSVLSSAAEAAVLGGASRLRPILMTSCAMIAGMLPMALGLGEAGAQAAPLGRAVVGGLLLATLTTLLVLPPVFAIIQARASRRSASLDPDEAANGPHSSSPSPSGRGPG